MAGVNATVTDTSEVTRSGVESSRAMVAQMQKQSEQLSELAGRVKQLESGFWRRRRAEAGSVHAH